MTAQTGKTLTVTYGAFACTIDGYDDPMPVLRSVVAYFRDLVADDKGFGTVPLNMPDPVPADARPSPLTPEEIASLAAREDGESRVTASVSTQAARATLLRPDPLLLRQEMGETEIPETIDLQDAAPEPDTEDQVAAALAERANAPGEPPFDRLLQTTEAAMQAPEAQRRAAGIAQFRTAVADLSGGDPPAPANDVTRYRSDLALLSRTGLLRTDPLVLTPDLRVDRAPERSRIELMPHEVVMDDGLAQHVAPLGLLDFITRTSAETVAERMEAAAAHAIVLEGRDSFSRPALLRAMQGLEPIGFEDSLKVFGSLLREGRLQKADYGRYTIAPESRFAAEAQAILT